MTGTLILALLFSAYFLWSIYMTTMTDEAAKASNYTHKGSLIGMTFYCTLPDEEDMMEVAGANMVSDQIVPVLIDYGMQFNKGELKMTLEEL